MPLLPLTHAPVLWELVGCVLCTSGFQEWPVWQEEMCTAWSTVEICLRAVALLFLGEVCFKMASLTSKCPAAKYISNGLSF